VNLGAVLAWAGSHRRWSRSLRRTNGMCPCTFTSGLCFIEPEELIGTAFEDMVSKELLVAG